MDSVENSVQKLMARRWREIKKWLTPGIGVKRWLLLLFFGITVLSLALAQIIVEAYRDQELPLLLDYLTLRFLPVFMRVILGGTIGLASLFIAIYELNRSILAPFARRRTGPLVDVMYNHLRRQKGIKLVALGGGTGLPAVLRGFKGQTTNLTAIVTVADDGGSSGKLRREFGVLPPGDLRNNITALADDEDLLTQLFQYRFAGGGLEGHSLGNLFLTALADLTGSMDQALVEAGRVLAIQGRVLPSTLQDVTLMAEIQKPDGAGLTRVSGESQITESGGSVERVFLSPESVRAYPDSIRAILAASLIVIGPGSLYTSILPNLLVSGIPEAIRASGALRIYVCNIAMQAGETDGFNAADHILALEQHIGLGLFDVVLANNAYPTQNQGITRYVLPVPEGHDVRRRYEIREADLTNSPRPWRHDPAKLSRAILGILTQHQITSSSGAEAV